MEQEAGDAGSREQGHHLFPAQSHEREACELLRQSTISPGKKTLNNVCIQNIDDMAKK